MKRLICSVICLSLLFLKSNSQSNSFPGTGNAGIGTGSPIFPFQIVSNNTSAVTNSEYLWVSEDGTSSQGFGVVEGASGASIFLPTFKFISSGINGFGGVITGQIPSDKDIRYSNLTQNWDAAFVIEASRSNNTKIQNSNLFMVRNYDEPVFSISANGNIGIGNIYSPNQKLTIDGQILAEEIRVVNNIQIPDYVFNDDFKLLSLKEKDEFIKKFKHLPSLKSANEIKKEEGVPISEFVMGLLKEIEELTLHVIELSKKLNSLENKIN